MQDASDAGFHYLWKPSGLSGDLGNLGFTTLFLAVKEIGQRRQEYERIPHIQEKHEGQHQTHIRLELDRRIDPGTHTDSQRHTGKGNRRPATFQRLKISDLQRSTTVQVKQRLAWH
ncbi:MAG: hypothetical protein ACI87W_000143 [Halieaceae bacterium]|jgi:hypothetical protein